MSSRFSAADRQNRGAAQVIRATELLPIVAVMMMVVVVMMMVMVPIVAAVPGDDHGTVVMVMMMVVILRKLHPRLITHGTLLLIHRLQDLAGIGDGLEEVGVGIGVQNIRRRRQRCGLS